MEVIAVATGSAIGPTMGEDQTGPNMKNINTKHQPMKRSTIILMLVTMASTFGLFSLNALCFAEASLKLGDASIPVPPQ
jgi:hypothetical protein